VTLRQVSAQSWRWVKRIATFAISVLKGLFTLVVVVCILFFQWALSSFMSRRTTVAQPDLNQRVTHYVVTGMSQLGEYLIRPNPKTPGAPRAQSSAPCDRRVWALWRVRGGRRMHTFSAASRLIRLPVLLDADRRHPQPQSVVDAPQKKRECKNYRNHLPTGTSQEQPPFRITRNPAFK
jgi:hypothetical protein